jgi:hypothetical protein
MGLMDMDAGTTQSRWRANRDFWCEKCQVQYCLHCSDGLGTVVRWHCDKTCEEHLRAVQQSKIEAERRRKALEADAQCVSGSHRAQAYLHDFAHAA